MRAEAGARCASAINEMRLKEQEARLTEEQFAQQLAEAGARRGRAGRDAREGHAARARCRPRSRGSTRRSGHWAQSTWRRSRSCRRRSERKSYLDAQSRRPDRGDRHARGRDPAHRPRDARAPAAHVRRGQRIISGRCSRRCSAAATRSLVLTGEEILDAGVQVIAQPPGKKNTTIHLLSGGEKALTALSLVFALFQLNPAPFCLLDEVDAPLDDHNTERFCDLVKKMSRAVAVPVHQPQQDHDGDREPAARHHHAGSRRVARGGGRYRGGDEALRRGGIAACRNRLPTGSYQQNPRGFGMKLKRIIGGW